MLEGLPPERGLPEVEQRSTGATLPEGLLRRVLEHIERNLDSKLKWDELAAAVGLDPFRFARGFKRATGVTPHQYVMATRVRRAMGLLAREGTSIANVALEVGCSCQSHLTTLFRMHTGTTPAAFRRAARESRRVLEHAAAGAASAPALRTPDHDRSVQELERFPRPAQLGSRGSAGNRSRTTPGIHTGRSLEFQVSR